MEDLVAYPLLASLFTCVPPLDEVAVLWDSVFALGGHFPVLCVVALILERFESGDKTVARLQPRGLAPLDARRIVARACAIAPRVPRSLYDVLERHARDVSVDRAAVRGGVGGASDAADAAEPSSSSSSSAKTSRAKARQCCCRVVRYGPCVSARP